MAQAGIQLVKRFEGCSLKSYLCPALVPTIGYGHTGPDVRLGQTITQEQADALLVRDYVDHESAVRRLVKAPLTDNELGALTSFTYNVGAHSFATSTMLRLINEQRYADAAGEFSKWTKGGGRVLPGLVTRRAAEAALFSA